MRCKNCNTELEEGELFCSNCGQKADIEQEKAVSEAEGIFCPKCGKKFTDGEMFCDNCGTNLIDDHALEKADKNVAGEKRKRIRHSGRKYAAVVAAVFTAGILGLGIFKISSRTFTNITRRNKILYVKEHDLYMTDTYNLEEKKRICFAPSTRCWYVSEPDPWTQEYGFYQIDGDMILQRFLTEDQNNIYFVKNYNVEKDIFDLYKANVLKLEDEELQDRGVSYYEVLGERILYIKNRVIYYGEGDEQKKFGKEVYDYHIDDEKKNIIWTEERKNGDEVTYNIYWQDLKQENKKVKLYSGLSSGMIGEYENIYPNKELTAVILQDNGIVYRITNDGDKEELCRADFLYAVNTDEESFYYSVRKADEDSDNLWRLKDHIYDDTKEMTEDDWKEIEEETWNQKHSDRLYFYSKGNIRKVSDIMFEQCSDEMETNCFLFCELNDDIKIRWSDYKKRRDEDSYFWSFRWLSDKKLVIDGEVVGNLGYGLDDYFGFINGQSGTLYLCSFKYIENHFALGKVYTIYLNDNQKAKIEECNLELGDAFLLEASERGLYYINDQNNGYGDLYYQDELLVSGVYEAQYLAPDKVLCCTDHDEENGCTYEIYDGEKTRQIGEGIKAIQYLEDGTALMLADYDSGSRTGNLIYYDGEKNVTIEDEVSSFVIKDGRGILFHR